MTASQNNIVLPPSAYPKFYVWMISGISIVYVIVSFGLSGIPGVSRLALYSAALLSILLIFYVGKLKLPLWSLIFLLFYTYIALPAFALKEIPYDKLGTLIVVFIGTLSIGMSMHNNILSYKVVAYGAIIAAIINIVAVHYGIDTAPRADVGRYSGFMANPNALSMRLAFAAFLIWLLPERFNWPLRLFGIFLVAYGMYISGSRKGIVLAAALLILVFMNHIIKLSKTKLILYATVIIVSGIAFYGVITEFAVKYGTNIVAIDRTFKALSGQDKSFKDRLSLIKVGFKLWRESPIFGHGFDQFAILSRFGGYAHNNYIELAVSGGLIALLLFYSLHIIILRNAMKQSFAFGLRLMIFMAAIILMDTAVVSFYDKAVMCMLGALLAVSSKQHKQNS